MCDAGPTHQICGLAMIYGHTCILCLHDLTAVSEGYAPLLQFCVQLLTHILVQAEQILTWGLGPPAQGPGLGGEGVPYKLGGI